MKKALVLLSLLFLVSASAANSRIGPLLTRALNNEREAAARYQAFEQKAVEEGYPGAASLFRAAARAELVHADRFAMALRERGLAVPEPELLTPRVGSTPDNLRDAASAEMRERDGFYREAIEEAQGDDVIVGMFDQTRDTEVEHANLLMAASRNVEAMRGEKTYYVCGHCGYTTDIDLPMCALCRVDKHPHAVH